VTPIAVAGEEPVGAAFVVGRGVDRRRRGVGLLPVAAHDHVAAGEDLAVGRRPQPHAKRRRARTPEPAGPLRWGQRVVLGATAVHHQQRGGLGQAVDLDELPAELGLDALDGPGGRRRTGDHDAEPVAAGDRPVPRGGRVEDGGDDGGGAAHERDAVLVDAAQDLGAVDLAQHDVGDAHGGCRIRHAPAVAVEHRQRVQVDVAVRHRGLPAERRGVDPQVPVGELHALGAGRGARGVVDRGGGILVPVPLAGLGAVAEQLGVGLVPEHHRALGLDALQRLLQLGVDQQQLRPAVADDVLDLLGVQPEVDRHQDPAPTGHTEEARQQPRRVVAHDGDPLAGPEAERVEPGGLRPCPLVELGIGQRAPRRRRLDRLVDDRGAPRVDLERPVDVVADRQRNSHGRYPQRSVVRD
jgi:hypothetical protein